MCRECLPCQPWFSVEEPSTERKLDVPATFGPVTALSFLGKVCTCGYIVLTQVMAWEASPYLYFYYAYYTSWSLFFATLYAVFSFLNSMCQIPQPVDGRVQGRGKITWIVFNLAVFGQGLSTLVYWALVHDYGRQVEYLEVATHGLVFAVVCIDGFVISRIPLRWMHIWLGWTVLGCFLLWTIVHEALGIGNPNEQDNDPETNDDAIYSSLSWNEENARQSAVLAGIMLLVVTPALFCILRSLSVWNACGCCCGGQDTDRRRYIPDPEKGYLRFN